MQEDHVPSIGPRFWVAFMIASVFGANLGDLVDTLALGSVGRISVFVALLAVIFIGERYDRSRTEACYWMAIVVIQAASMRLADFAAIELGLGGLLLIGGLAALIVTAFWVMRSPASLTISTYMVSRPGAAAKPLADTAHWTAMVLASTLGAATSDILSVGLGLGPFRATIILSVLVAGGFGLHRLPSANRLFTYWVTSTMIRALGAAVGDLLTKNTHLPIALPVSAASSGAMLVALLLLWPKPRRAASK